MNVNLLLISFAFPPAGGVGVLRALSFAKFLPESGIRVDVLTTRNTPSVANDPSLSAEVPADVAVHRAWTLDLPFALRKRVKSILAGSGKAKWTADARRPDLSSRFLAALKRAAGDLLLPDPQIGWLPFAGRAARRLVRERGIDIVLITVPPFSAAKLVSSLRSEFPDLPILLDFRDEWLTSTLGLWSFSMSEKAVRVARQVEHDAVHDATRVIAVTRAARKEISRRYPEEAAEKFVHISNGFSDSLQLPSDVSALTPPARATGEIVMTYIGSIYASTDPSTFVDGVLALPADVRSRFRFRFIGHIEDEASRRKLATLGESVEFFGFLPQAEALTYMRDTDYLLLISHDAINVSAKFYDYLGGGKPIFAAVHPEGEIRCLLEETRAGLWADVNDAYAIAGAFKTLAAEAHDLPAQRSDIVQQYRRSVQAKALAALCYNLVGQR